MDHTEETSTEVKTWGRDASYDPADNKLRLRTFSKSSLSKEEVERLKAHGFHWAPRQELWVAPAWTPEREDLLIELCGEIGDEDTSLVDRAAQRSERFAEYSEHRAEDAERARAAVSAIADNIPLGQPILVGHHSEKRARKDAERIENGMRRAVQMWDQAKYWQDRAKACLRHAKYLERSDVRHRRIKKIEADKRKQERYKAEAETALRLWTADGLTQEQALRLAGRGGGATNLSVMPRENGSGYWDAYDVLQPDDKRWKACPAMTVAEVVEKAKRAYPRSIERYDRWIWHYENRLAYERAMLEDAGGLVTSKYDLQPGGEVLVDGEWRVILRVNKAQGVISSVTTTAPRVVTWTREWKAGVEEIQDYQAPTAEVAEKVKVATKLPPLCNYPGEGFKEMTQAEWNARHKWSDFSYTATLKATEKYGTHRLRRMPKGGFKYDYVYLTDAKRVDPPAPAKEESAPEVKSEPDLTSPPPVYRPREQSEEEKQVEAMRRALKQGVQTVVAPQLFPTPAHVADRMVSEAELFDGVDILEPSAGTGALIDAIERTQYNYTIVEVEKDYGLCELLRTRHYDPIEADFLTLTPTQLQTFDRVIMNPPFENGADIKHILHARQFLKPGGKLVAICANGPRQQEKLQPLADTWEPLPEGTFAKQGTNVRTVLLTMSAEAATQQEEPKTETLTISYGSTKVGEAQTPSFSDAFKVRQMPTTPIRKPSIGVRGLPLFDPTVQHEAAQERAQGGLFTK